METKYISVLKSETKKTAFYEYGGFDILPLTKEEAVEQMTREGYGPTEYKVLKITKEESEKFINQWRPAGM